MKIEQIIANNPNKTILFLGRVTHFTPQELVNFIQDQGMQYADHYEGQSDIALLVLSSMLTPLEEQLSYDLYDQGIADISLAQFESYYTQHIKPNTLLMSLKLSNDQARLRRLLQNEAFGDEVYLKLFMMVDWHGEGIHENDSNRDITISFVKRFYRPDGFRDPAMIYAPTTVMNIAQESDDPMVLEAILTMPNHEIKVSRYETHRPKNLRETVAFNEAISHESIKRLMAYRDERIDYFLAANAALGEWEQERLYERTTKEARLMLAHNDNLSDKLFEKLLMEGDEVVKSLLRYQPISEYRLNLVKENPLIVYVGQNRNITDSVASLLRLEHEGLDFQLASNDVVASEVLEKLYEKYGEPIASSLAQNSNLSEKFLHIFYKRGTPEVIKALATNMATPKVILAELCERHDRELNMLLASNPSVDIKYLREFQLDTSLMRILAENETYGKSVLQGLGI